MNLKKLLECNDVALAHGTIFRCNKASYPYEKKVDFIVRRDPDSPSGYAVMAISRSQAGKTFQQLPTDCLLPPDTPPLELDAGQSYEMPISNPTLRLSNQQGVVLEVYL